MVFVRAAQGREIAADRISMVGQRATQASRLRRREKIRRWHTPFGA
jgi:hypothetical protein